MNIEGLERANARIREYAKRGYISSRELNNILAEECGICNPVYNGPECLTVYELTPTGELK